MKKEKWLLKQIDEWQGLDIIDEQTADVLKARYEIKKNINFMIVLFSIIGALLIGTGVILIGARNWEYFPLSVRVVIAFLPLVVSQGLAVYTVRVKHGSLAWREAVAVLVTASVFTAVALVGQAFHLPGDFAVYVLTCGLLSLPMIYILNAASPLLVYYWTILNWAALEGSPLNSLILFALFAVGSAFVYLKRNELPARVMYMTWITVIAGFVLVLIMGVLLETGLLLVLLCYFVLLISAVFGGKLPEELIAPFRVVGGIGVFVIMTILTYNGMWQGSGFGLSGGGAVLVVGMLAGTMYFAYTLFKQNMLKFSFVASLFALCLLRFIWAAFDMTSGSDPYILMFLTNVLMFGLGVGFIYYGAKSSELARTNVGMAAVCIIILLRFFDSGLDILLQGIVFILLGSAFLTVNVLILRAKKAREIITGEEGTL
jgi:hypothetical protein